MAEYIIQSNTLAEIADAIRNKTNKTNTIPVVKFAEEINSLQLDPSFGLPQIDETLPSDASIIVGKSVVCNVLVLDSSEDYTYQWYVNNIAVVDANQSSYTFTGTEFGPTTIYCNVINKNGGISTSRVATITVKSTIPTFTYSGTYKIVNDQDSTISQSKGNWKIKFLTSGTLIFTSLNGAADGIDVFCCGGGGGGGASIAGGGGGGGYTTTERNKSVALNTEYVITIGSGGGNNVSGGSTTAFNVTANGGNPGGWYSTSTGSATGGAGGSGGGQYGGTYGGSDGGNGVGTYGGKGQGTTTREFGESSGRLYAGGGSGGLYNDGNTNKWIPAIDESAAGSAQHAPANRGGGGGGSCHTLGPAGGSGGSGIVVIRNKR